MLPPGMNRVTGSSKSAIMDLSCLTGTRLLSAGGVGQAWIKDPCIMGIGGLGRLVVNTGSFMHASSEFLPQPPSEVYRHEGVARLGQFHRFYLHKC